VSVESYCCLEPGDIKRESTRILLVYPKVGSEAKGVSIYPPLSVLYPAGLLKDYSVAIFDQRVDEPERFERLLEEGPACVGFSIMTGVQIKYALELAAKVKEKYIPTVFGGVHATILPEETLRDERVDYVVAGEGEGAMRELVEALGNRGNIPGVMRDGTMDLNSIPELPYELVDVEKYVGNAALAGRTLPFLFSRGCPFACTFCCNPVITQRRWRSMSVDKAVKQLDKMVDKFNLDGILFWDENISVNPKLLKKLAEKINGRFNWLAQTRANTLLQYDLSYLSEMGARRFACGLESGSPSVLEQIQKEETVEEYIEVNRRLAQTNISVWYSYIIGYPFESLEDLKLTIKLALQMLQENPRAQNNTFYLVTPYPGTQIGQRYYQEKMPKNLAGWAEFGRHNFEINWYPEERKILYSRICFSSKFVGRKIEGLFPEDQELKQLVKVMTDKWRRFDFDGDVEWDSLQATAWKVLKRLFGENAY